MQRKFTSQTSDNMEMERQRWEDSGKRIKKREDQRGKRARRKKMQVREKVGKSRLTVFFPVAIVPVSLWGCGG